MTRSRITGGLMLPAALAVTALLTATACFDDAVTDATGEQPAVNVLLGPGETVLPAGELGLADIRIANFDFSVPDAFARATGTTFSYSPGCCYFYGNSVVLGEDQDPRAPMITGSEITSRDLGSGELFYVLGAEFWPEGNIFDWWGGFGGVPADTRLYLGLARYGVEINGALDQEQILTGEPVTEPDSLIFVGGSPGGESQRSANAFNRATPYPAEPDANPYVFGFAESSSDGNVGFDVVTSSFDATLNQVYYTGSFDASESPVGPNDLTEFAADQYNYLVVWDEDPLANPDAQPVFRLQIAADLEGNSLTPVNNGFAPFPPGITDTETFRELPGGADAFAAPGQINLSLSGLPVLGGSATYAVYLFDEETDSYALVTTFESPGPDPETPLEITLTPEETGLDFGQFNQVIVSIETGAPGETPSEARFLVREFLSTDFALSQGPFTFGRANLTPAQEFQIAGSGEATFIRDSLLVDLRRLSPPPAGFHYQSYLIRGEIGAIEAEQRLHTIELDELGNAVDRVGEEEVGSFANFETYVVALEPDAASGLTPAFIQVSENYIDKFGADFFLNGTGDGDGGT